MPVWKVCDVIKEPAAFLAEAVRLRSAGGWAPMVLCVNAAERQAVEGALSAASPGCDFVACPGTSLDVRARGLLPSGWWVVYLRVILDG